MSRYKSKTKVFYQSSKKIKSFHMLKIKKHLNIIKTQFIYRIMKRQLLLKKKKNKNKDLKHAYSLIHSFAKDHTNTKYRYLLEGMNEGSIRGTKTSTTLPFHRILKTKKQRRTIKSKLESILPKFTLRRKKKSHTQ